MDLSIRPVTAPNADVRALLAELNATRAVDDDADQRHGLALEQLFQPSIGLFIARLDRAPVGCGGVALFDDDAEVTRMDVRPTVRGRGVAKALLAQLADEARAAGLSVLRLETRVHQREAMGFYERFGFTRYVAFGRDAAMPSNAIARSVCFALPLAPSA
ncbi:MAG TPA: GNAT family N-acetyltransferase [Acetobacteraceae bacterium]|jgi:putative acetyltransferase|nr:GNAT family N-acetyltransferase [Acetobacteraceae bacterium]